MRDLAASITIERTLRNFRRCPAFYERVELAVSFENDDGLIFLNVFADEWSPFERRRRRLRCLRNGTCRKQKCDEYSAKGAKYNSQGQARSASPLVTNQKNSAPALKGRNTISALQA